MSMQKSHHWVKSWKWNFRDQKQSPLIKNINNLKKLMEEYTNITTCRFRKNFIQNTCLCKDWLNTWIMMSKSPRCKIYYTWGSFMEILIKYQKLILQKYWNIIQTLFSSIKFVWISQRNPKLSHLIHRKQPNPNEVHELARKYHTTVRRVKQDILLLITHALSMTFI